MQQMEVKCSPCKAALQALQQPSRWMMSHQTAAAMLGTWSELSQGCLRMRQTQRQPPQGMISMAKVAACRQTLRQAPKKEVRLGRRPSWHLHRANQKRQAPLLAGHHPLLQVMIVTLPRTTGEQEAPATWRRACWQHWQPRATEAQPPEAQQQRLIALCMCEHLSSLKTLRDSEPSMSSCPAPGLQLADRGEISMATRLRRRQKAIAAVESCIGSRLCSCPACRLQMLAEAWSSSRLLSLCPQDRFDCSSCFAVSSPSRPCQEHPCTSADAVHLHGSAEP